MRKTWTTDFNWTSNMLLAQIKLISIFHWTAWFWKRSETGIAVRKSKLNQSSNIQTNRGKDVLFWVFWCFILNCKYREPSTETWKEALHWVTSLFLQTCCIWFTQGNFTSSEKTPVHIHDHFAFTYRIYTFAISTAKQLWRPVVFIKNNTKYSLLPVLYILCKEGVSSYSLIGKD